MRNPRLPYLRVSDQKLEYTPISFRGNRTDIGILGGFIDARMSWYNALIARAFDSCTQLNIILEARDLIIFFLAKGSLFLWPKGNHLQDPWGIANISNLRGRVMPKNSKQLLSILLFDDKNLIAKEIILKCE